MSNADICKSGDDMTDSQTGNPLVLNLSLYSQSSAQACFAKGVAICCVTQDFEKSTTTSSLSPSCPFLLIFLKGKGFSGNEASKKGNLILFIWASHLVFKS